MMPILRYLELPHGRRESNATEVLVSLLHSQGKKLGKPKGKAAVKKGEYLLLWLGCLGGFKQPISLALQDPFNKSYLLISQCAIMLNIIFITRVKISAILCEIRMWQVTCGTSV